MPVPFKIGERSTLLMDDLKNDRGYSFKRDWKKVPNVHLPIEKGSKQNAENCISKVYVGDAQVTKCFDNYRSKVELK